MNKCDETRVTIPECVNKRIPECVNKRIPECDKNGRIIAETVQPITTVQRIKPKITVSIKPTLKTAQVMPFMGEIDVPPQRIVQSARGPISLSIKPTIGNLIGPPSGVVSNAQINNVQPNGVQSNAVNKWFASKSQGKLDDSPKVPKVPKPVPTADASLMGDALSLIGDATSVIPLVMGGNKKGK
jgi:hypothetical protein